jgi:hypothetical protein
MAEERFGALHAMLNCAGYLRAAPLLETTEEMLDATINVNLKGVFYGCKSAVPAMRRAGGGSIGCGRIRQGRHSCELHLSRGRPHAHGGGLLRWRILRGRRGAA